VFPWGDTAIEIVASSLTTPREAKYASIILDSIAGNWP